MGRLGLKPVYLTSMVYNRLNSVEVMECQRGRLACTPQIICVNVALLSFPVKDKLPGKESVTLIC